jgi:pyruvate/2-oxoglutarate/acetoin dehydrogenase E1 component
MALRGLRPVVEIMFGDFLALAADQLINHTGKFRWMYNGGKSGNDQVKLPMVVRTPMGGRRGYGPTHSQTLEKLVLGTPGIRVVAPTALTLPNGISPGELLSQIILHTDDPVLFVENKLLYLLPLWNEENKPDWEFSSVPSETTHSNASFKGSIQYPAYTLHMRGGPDAGFTIACYGYMAELARQAAERLAYEFEIFSEIVVLTQLAPFSIDPVLQSVNRTHRLLTVEEGNLSMGWGSEIVARCSESLGQNLRQTHRLAARDLPIPASAPLEAAVLPSVEQIIDIGREFLQNR